MAYTQKKIRWIFNAITKLGTIWPHESETFADASDKIIFKSVPWTEELILYKHSADSSQRSNWIIENLGENRKYSSRIRMKYSQLKPKAALLGSLIYASPNTRTLFTVQFSSVNDGGLFKSRIQSSVSFASAVWFSQINKLSVLRKISGLLPILPILRAQAQMLSGNSITINIFVGCWMSAWPLTLRISIVTAALPAPSFKFAQNIDFNRIQMWY